MNTDHHHVPAKAKDILFGYIWASGEVWIALIHQSCVAVHKLCEQSFAKTQYWQLENMLSTASDNTMIYTLYIILTADRHTEHQKSITLRTKQSISGSNDIREI